VAYLLYQMEQGTAPASSLPIPAQTSHNVLIGAMEGNGVAGTPDTHVVTVQGIAGGTVIPFNETQIGGVAIVTGGVPGSQGVGGPTATSSAYAANPLPGGGEGLSAEPGAVTTGHPVSSWLDLTGKQVTIPYAPRELRVSGTASSTGTGATTIIAAQGAGVKIYVTAVQCWREDAGATGAHVTLDDVSSSIVGLPNSGGGGGNNPVYPTPLVTAANAPLTFTSSAAITTVYCNAQGYVGY
jgi:hypothetical protein